MPVFKRKSYPEGTKRWVAQVELGPDPLTGRRRYKQSYHLRKSEADAAEATMREGFRKGTLRAAPDRTLADYLAAWLRQAVPQLEPKTRTMYRYYAEKVLAPALGRVKIGRLSKADVQSFVTALHESGRGATWIKGCVAVGRKAYNDAIDQEMVTANPFLRLKLPKVRARSFPVYSPAQVRQLFAAIGEDPDRNVFILAVFSGARLGELLALTWSDVDFDRGTLAIGRSLTHEQGTGLVVKRPKTAAGSRTVTIHPLGMAALRRQREILGPAESLVFPSRRTGVHRWGQDLRRKLARICTGNGLPVLRFHDLRHLHASLLIAVGVHAKVISARLGHSRIDVTMNTYSHLMAGVDEDASTRLGELLE